MNNLEDQAIRKQAKANLSKMNDTVNNVAEAVNEATESIVTKGVELGIGLKNKFNELKKTKIKVVKE